MVRVYMSKAWVDSGDFAIEPVIRRWGMVDDKAIREGRLYSSKAPLQSLLGIPAYALAKPLLRSLGAPINKRTITWVVRIFGAALLGIAFSWVLIAWCRRRSVELGAHRELGTAIGLGIALGTMIYPYSITFTGHGVAALAAGGCYLAVVGMSRSVDDRAWRRNALAAGFLGGATPFAEYPAALVAAPALFAAFALTTGWARRAQLFAWLALGGALPFGTGLWAHARLWGHPFRTGYTFLENKSYVQVHGEGFFGVSFPKGEALIGALFSPGTGLFFYTPLLLIGLGVAVWALFGRRPQDVDPPPARALAVATVVAFIASLYFISSHKGWRGGWTVGPRYIVAVAPMLGLWAVESLRWPAWRPVAAGLAGLSIVTTGFAAALYPHLSDVYTNPLASFLWPSYWSGETTYGLGHALGLTGHAANAVHVAPLVVAIFYCLIVGVWRASPSITGIVKTTIPLLVGVFVIAMIPEKNASAAKRENQRLWGFWEPAQPKAKPRARPGRIFRARSAYRRLRVETVDTATTTACGSFDGGFCRYGDQPWQRFGPERVTMAGVSEDVLFIHPVTGKTVRITVPVRPQARSAVIRYGMADTSVRAPNPHLIDLVVRQGTKRLSRRRVPRTVGIKTLELTLTSTAPLIMELSVQRDGARVFGFDVEQYR